MGLSISIMFFILGGIILYFLEGDKLAWLKRMVVIILVSIVVGSILGLTLKSCDHEYKFDQAKIWSFKK